MTPLLLFSLVLFVAVLASTLAARSAASISVLFIVAGYMAGPGGWGYITWHPQDRKVEELARWALLAVLFTDGMHLGLGEMRRIWRLPGRALLLGMPLTLLVLAGLAHWLAGLDWLTAFLLAAVLSPTDPVFASAIVEREEIDVSLRRLLNVESGMNDGLALPVVIGLLHVLRGEPAGAGQLGAEVAGGICLGAILPWIARTIRPRAAAITPAYRPLYALAVGLTAISLAGLLHVNEYLAAFCAGVSLATVDPPLRDAYGRLGKQLGELLKLATLLAFGALIEPAWIRALSPWEWGFVVASLVLARPLGLLPALAGSPLDWRHRAAAAWFGPKGFASLVYALLVLHAGVPDAHRLYHLAALVIVLSIVAHSSTDVPMARWLTRRQANP